MNIVLIGPPGCGKGMQSEMIAKRYSLCHVSTGEMFREIAKQNNAHGKKIRSMIESGNLVPDKLALSLLKKRLSQDDCKRGFVLDGFPRNLNQAKTLSKIGRIDHVLYLHVPVKVALKRLLLRGRKDDNASVIKERVEIYRKSTEPTLKYYKRLKLLRKINGNRSIESVFADIASILG